MCFRSKEDGPDAAPKPAQIPLQQSTSTASPFKASGPRTSTDYPPPVGPPPSDGDGAPPGPPPGQHMKDEYAIPPGPPPSQEPKKQDWEVAVPDTADLPPPPVSGFTVSPTNNASEAEAVRGEEWCKLHPLLNQLVRLDNAALNALHTGNINLFQPPYYNCTLQQTGLGVWKGVKGFSQPGYPDDMCIASYLPLYTVAAHSPLATGQKKTIYYEVNILKESQEEISLALGYIAPPYPSFRLPGWHRGSLGVHGDDGHKYINDLWGGKSFTQPFRRGQTVGLGMDFMPGIGGGIQVEVFFTRNGVENGRWDLHEERDAEQDRDVIGLDGFYDLYAAIGLFNKASVEIVFTPGRWKWRGYQG